MERRSLDAAVALGPLYGVLNFATSLVRLWAIVAFVNGKPAWARAVLPPVIGVLAGNIAAGPVIRLAEPAPDQVDGAETSASAHVRAIVRQGLGLALALLGAVAGTLWLSPAACGLPADGPALCAGAGAGALFCAAWSLVARAVPRERLTVESGGTADVSAATEDEMLRQMPPGRRATSLSLRCAKVAVWAYADTLLLFAFLPAALDGAEPTVAPRPLAAALAAVAFGSNHLRFRGEWALAAGFGLAMCALRSHFDCLTPVLGASVVFAVYRNRARAHADVGQFKST